MQDQSQSKLQTYLLMIIWGIAWSLLHNHNKLIADLRRHFPGAATLINLTGMFLIAHRYSPHFAKELYLTGTLVTVPQIAINVIYQQQQTRQRLAKWGNNHVEYTP